MKALYRSGPARVITLVALFQLFLASVSHASLQIKIGQNFAGSDNSQTGITPADGNGAIGPNHFVEMINGAFAIYNKTNGARIRRISDAQFWADAGVILSSDATISDPRIIYDPTVQRWFVSEIDLNTGMSDPTILANNFLLAISDTADPRGSWHGVRFVADPDTGFFADFPTLGVDSNAVYLSGDLFFGGNDPIGPALWSIPKSDLLINTTPAIITNATWYGVMSYADRGDVLQPATCMDGSSSGDILAAGDLFDDTELIASKIQNSGGANATLQPSTSIKVDEFTVPFDATQPDGTSTLADNDARLSAKIYTVGGIIYAVQNIEANNRAAIRWYRIDATNDALLESGTITNSDLDLIFPSIAVTANGVMVIGCNGSSIHVPVSCYAYVGQTVNGVTSFNGPVLLKAGTVSNYHDFIELSGQAGDSRWGDYSATSLDPNDPSRFWTIQMLPQTSTTWITHVTEMLVIPQLSISQTDTNVNLSWPLFGAKYRLQTTTNLSPSAAWSIVPQSAVTNGDQISVTLPANGGQQFFRLVEP